MPSKYIVCAAVLLPIMLLMEIPPSRADELTPPSRVVEVTVYRASGPIHRPQAVLPRGQALVTREARLSVPAGDHKIILAEIPAVADPDSIRVSGSGAAGTTIGGIEVREAFREPQHTPEYQKLENELEELTRRQAALEDRLKAIAALREFLASLKASAGQQSSQDLLTKGFAVESWEKAFGFLSRRWDALADEERELRASRKEISEKIQVARQRLGQLVSQGGIQRWNAEVQVIASRAGELALRVTYLARHAEWSPQYDARLDVTSGKVIIDWKAQVAQQTGEDWKDVSLVLSTTRPTGGIDLPKLTSAYLTSVQNVAGRARGGFVDVDTEDIAKLKVLGRDDQDVLALAPGVTDTSTTEGVMLEAEPAPPPVPVEMQAATASRQDLAVTVELAGRLSIPSDGQPHSHTIASEEMDAEIEYHAVPRLVPKVFLAAQVTLKGEIPLLPGRVQHFVGSDLVGTSHMQERVPGEEFPLSFGPDERVKIERKRILREVDRKGRYVETRYRFLTTLENHLGKPAVLELQDQIPVSGDSRISVRLDDRATTPGYVLDPTQPGILTWDITLPAAGEQEVVLEYSVRAPHDLAVAGQE